jgi:hypothetical protein
MYIKRIITTLCAAAFLWPAAAQQITNTEAEAIEGKIRVTCQLQASAYQDLYLSYSEDNGRSFLPCLTVGGDLVNQLGGSKELIWDCGKDGVIMGNFVFRITCMPAVHPPQTAATETKKKSLPLIKAKVPKEKPQTELSSAEQSNAGKKGSIFVMPGITMPIDISENVLLKSSLNYSLMAGYVKLSDRPDKSYGAYLRVKYVKEQKDSYRYDYYYDYYYHYEKKLTRVSFTFGGIKQLSRHCFLHAGIGYGNRAYTDSYSRHSIEIEGGTIFRFNRFLVGGGIAFEYSVDDDDLLLEPMLSIGYSF